MLTVRKKTACHTFKTVKFSTTYPYTYQAYAPAQWQPCYQPSVLPLSSFCYPSNGSVVYLNDLKVLKNDVVTHYC
jgi:hypothetical protein